MTSCWAVKNSEMLQDDDGHEAEGVPNVEGSMELLALETDWGTALLCATSKRCRTHTETATHRPEPREDARLIELRCPHTPTRVVEPVAKAVRLLLDNRAPVARVGAERAVRVGRFAELLHALRLRAARARVQRHLVVRREVHVLEHVDLATGRPVRAARPKRGPYGAPGGDVCGVPDEDGADLVELMRGEEELWGWEGRERERRCGVSMRL